MIKKRLFLALIAMSMSLAGCDKVNTLPADDTPTTDPTDVDPEGKGGEEGGDSGEGGESGGGGEQDRLSPEQRENANQFKSLFTLGLTLLKEDPTRANDYIVQYSEELALKDLTAQDVTSLIQVATSTLQDVTSLSDITPEEVIDLLYAVQEQELLDETVYFAIGFAKSYGRAFASNNEVYEPTIDGLLDKVDAEGYDLAENLYVSLDTLMTAYTDFTSPVLGEAVNAVYDEEKNELSVEAAKEVLNLSSMALMKTLRLRDNVKYFVHLFERLTGVQFDDETGPLTREVVAKEKKSVDQVIDDIFNAAGLLVLAANGLGQEDSEALEPIFAIANLVLQKEYAKAVMESISLIAKVGLQVLGLSDEYEDVQENAQGIYELITGVVDSFLDKEFTEKISALIVEETGAIDIDVLKEELATCSLRRLKVKAKLAVLNDLQENLVYFNTLLVECVTSALSIFTDMEQEEVEEYALRFDFSDEIDSAFEFLDEVLKFLDGIGEEFYDFIALINDKDYAGILRVIFDKVFEFIGTEAKFDDFNTDVKAVKGIIEDVVGAFMSEEFAAKFKALVDEGGVIDVEKLKALIVEVSETLRDLLEAKESVLDFAEKLVDVVKHVLLACGYEQDQVDAMFAEIDVNEIVNNLFEELSNLIDKFEGIAELSEIDDYAELVGYLMAIINSESEDISSLFGPLMSFLTKSFEILFNKFGIEKDPEEYTGKVIGVIAAVYLTYARVTSEDFINDAKAIYDAENHEIDFERLEIFLGILGDILSTFGNDSFKQILFDFIDLGREIIAKIEGVEVAEPEEESEETQDSLKDAISEVIAIIAKISSFLRNKDEKLHGYIELAEGIYNSIESGFADIQAIADNAEIEPDEKAYQIFDVLVRVADEVLDLLDPEYVDAESYKEYLHGEYAEFAKECLGEIVKVAYYKSIFALDPDFVLKVVSYLALAFIPTASKNSGQTTDLEYFDSKVMPGLLPLDEINEHIENEETGEWEFSEKESNISFEKVIIPGEEGETVEYHLNINTLRSYEIEEKEVEELKVYEVTVKWDYVSIVVPSLNAIPQALFGLAFYGLSMSDDIDAKIEEIAGYINGFIEIYKSSKEPLPVDEEEGELPEVEPEETEFDKFIAIVEEFTKEDGALLKQLYKDVLMGACSLVSPFIALGEGEEAEVDFTSYVFSVILNGAFILRESYEEGAVDSFKAVVEDFYNVLVILNYDEAFLSYLSEEYFEGKALEIETAEEFADLFEDFFESLLKPAATPELGA